MAMQHEIWSVTPTQSLLDQPRWQLKLTYSLARFNSKLQHFKQRHNHSLIHSFLHFLTSLLSLINPTFLWAERGAVQSPCCCHLPNLRSDLTTDHHTCKCRCKHNVARSLAYQPPSLQRRRHSPPIAPTRPPTLTCRGYAPVCVIECLDTNADEEAAETRHDDGESHERPQQRRHPPPPARPPARPTHNVSAGLMGDWLIEVIEWIAMRSSECRANVEESESCCFVCGMLVILQRLPQGRCWRAIASPSASASAFKFLLWSPLLLWIKRIFCQLRSFASRRVMGMNEGWM